MTVVDPVAPTPIGADRRDATRAELRELDGRTVAFFRVDGRHPASTGATEAEVVARALELAEQIGCPVVGVVASIAAHPGSEGLDALVAWGRVAARVVRLSGVVPLLVAVTGPVHGGLTAVVGLADHVVVTTGATLYVNGPGPIRALSGSAPDPVELGGAAVHATRSGVASLVAEDEADALDAIGDLLAHLPDNHLCEPPRLLTRDPVERATAVAAAAVPAEPTRSYDVRRVLLDVFDEGSFVEVHAEHAANLVCGYAHLGGRSVAVVANQPAVRAGTLDIAASCKGARHVQGADALGLPILTFVDTPGYEPGRDLEWRGMIRHGAKLVHAYADATVPRLGVVLRKAYGGAYIVMDSRTMGNDLTVAWPTAEIAVMGAPAAVAVLHRRELAESATPDAARGRLEDAYRRDFCSPRIAAERGLVDRVIDPRDTRRILAAALARLAPKRPAVRERRHSNGPI